MPYIAQAALPNRQLRRPLTARALTVARATFRISLAISGRGIEGWEFKWEKMIQNLQVQG